MDHNDALLLLLGDLRMQVEYLRKRELDLGEKVDELQQQLVDEAQNKKTGIVLQSEETPKTATISSDDNARNNDR